jgi:hypothetical protein
MDILALRITSLTDRFSIILHPEQIGIPLSDSHLFHIFAAVTCDQIWFASNKTYHEDLVPNAMDISFTINRIVKELHLAWNTILNPKQVVWQKPRPPFYKINYDTAIRKKISAQSAICCDSTGTIIQYSTIINPPCSSAVYGEATTALLAVRLALSLKLQSFILEGDSLIVTLTINNPTITQDWRISSIISQILSTIPSTTSWSPCHVNRSANFCAHHMAN